jgi:F-box/WD-40 domain protein MET30
LFGHEEGVWSLAFDKLRTVSGSLDKTIKVWDTESGECLYTLNGPEGPVTCVGLGDTKIVGGSADGTVSVWDFGVRTYVK